MKFEILNFLCRKFDAVNFLGKVRLFTSHKRWKILREIYCFSFLSKSVKALMTFQNQISSFSHHLFTNISQNNLELPLRFNVFYQKMKLLLKCSHEKWNFPHMLCIFETFSIIIAPRFASSQTALSTSFQVLWELFAKLNLKFSFITM